MATSDPFGRVVLIIGPEGLLADRAVAALVKAARTAAPEVEVTESDAARLDGTRLAEMTSASLFSTARVAVITDLAGLPRELADAVAALADEPLADLLLALVHGGGVRGKSLLDRLRRARVEVVDCPSPKPWELPQFVRAEAGRVGGSTSADAASFLVEAVGHDLRALAGAMGQVGDDAESGAVTLDQARRYFAGRSEVTSFAVADEALGGRTGAALEQLRWAMNTGVVPVLVTSALASGLRGLGRLVTAPSGLRDPELAREVGVPPWKLKSMRVQARGWDQAGLARALRAVATADAEVKGAADDAAYALERAVITVSRTRRG
ncbi:MAG: DNA polymerase III subunit delta [Actinomycetes bacterium]